MAHAPTGIRLTSPRDVLDSIPHALGFTPRDSLVIVLLRDCDGGRRRTVLTVRIDLVGPLLPDAALVDWMAVASAAKSTQATASLMAVFVDSEPTSMQALQQVQGELMQQASHVLTSVGARLTDVLVVMGGRYFSLMCEDLCCCPSEGTAYDARTPGSAGLELRVWAGSSPLVDRDELRKRFASDADEVDLVIDELRRLEAGLHHPAGEHVSPAQAPSRRRLVRRVIRAALASFDLEEAAWALTALRDVHVRDGVLAAVLTAPDANAKDEADDQSDEHAMRRYVARLTRCAPASYVAAPATMASILEWINGDGAAANITLDRALNHEADYRLAMLMAEVVRSAVPPTQVRQLLARAA